MHLFRKVNLDNKFDIFEPNLTKYYLVNYLNN